MNDREKYEWVLDHARETAHLESIRNLLAWDQRTLIPPKGNAHRTAQTEVLTKWILRRWTDPKFGEVLMDLARSDLVQDPVSAQAVNIREWRRLYDRSVAVPAALAMALARAASEGRAAWQRAKTIDNWTFFEPYLDRIVSLKREEADALGYATESYDALLEGYEPGETTAGLDLLFRYLRPRLMRLLDSIRGSSGNSDRTRLAGPFPVAQQQRFCRRIAQQLGYDLEGGRLDQSAHPFTVSIGPGDVRLTNRYDERCLATGLFGTMHEAGHGIYHQGLRSRHWGTPMGMPVSLGVHESQARFWENHVGRSRSFWRAALPLAGKYFPALVAVLPETCHRAFNQVRPSLIRTEADEVTYDLHVMVRFQLERALLSGNLRVSDLPSAWRESYRQFLGETPSDHRTGVLQDVHWAAGHFGYFPTYTLGNWYAAQWAERIDAEIGPLEDLIEKGRFFAIRNWLRDRIHRHGKRHRALRLVAVVTGKDPDPGVLTSYLEHKYGQLYGL